MVVADVMIETLFVLANLSMNAVIDQNCSFVDEIWKLLPKQRVSVLLSTPTVLIYPISLSCLVELFEETWQSMIEFFDITILKIQPLFSYWIEYRFDLTNPVTEASLKLLQFKFLFPPFSLLSYYAFFLCFG